VISAAVDYSTPSGEAHLVLDVAQGADARIAPPGAGLSGVLVLGHGAGGDIDAPDLLAARDAALAHGLAVVRVRQPYRVAGRRAPAPAARLDEAFGAVLAGIAELPGLSAGLPLFVGGRSSGARVAARTASAVGAAGLVALAFPLVPPGRPLVTRIDELVAAGVPTLVVQGGRDAFGGAVDVREAAGGAAGLEVVEVAHADHSFRTRRSDPTTSAQSLTAVADAVGTWLGTRLAGT
jgi:predicted alpha/beta-hydrolase family hydrolase